MKRFNILATMMATTLLSFAYDFDINGIYYDITSSSENTVAVTYRDASYSSYSGNIIIPAEVTYSGITYSVKSIGYHAFNGCSELAQVKIPDSVIEIGKYAFNNCTGLASVTIGNSVAQIDLRTFSGCASLTRITIPNSVTSIGNYAFNGCTSLTELCIEDGTEPLSLGYNNYDSQFYGEGLFFDCPLETLYLGRNISYSTDSSHGISPFLQSATLNSVTIGNSVTAIGSYLFRQCKLLTQASIPNSVTSIGDGAFFCCTGLTNLSIPNSVTSIGASAFASCKGLADHLSIPNSVTSIGASAFANCKGLTSITIGNSVTSIGNNAFSDCSGLTEITIPNSVTSINDYTFSGCSGLTQATIGNSITKIGYCAFVDCTGLTEITIPNSVTSIGFSSFRRCSGLKQVTIGNSVQTIGDYAFSECINLSEFKSPNTTPPSIYEKTFNQVDKENCTLYVPKDCRNIYWQQTYWEDFYNIIEQTDIGKVHEVIADNESIETIGGKLVIKTSMPTIVTIYTMSGRVAFNDYVNGELSIELPHGIYIAKTNSMTKKITL